MTSSKMEKTGARREIEGTSMKRAPSPGLYPWLVYKHGEKHQRQTFCSILESGATKISRRYIPELRNKKIVACSYGWVVLRDKKGMHYSLWNPVTSESISLPPLNLKPNQYIGYCLLTDSPRDTDSKILLFGGNFYSILCCHLSSHKQWIEIGYYNQIRNLKQEKNQKYFLQKPLSCNGKIYATPYCYAHLLLIELDGSNNLKVSLQAYLPSLQHMYSPRVRDYLVESIGEIVYIAFNLGGVNEEEVAWVEVFKFDVSSMTWAKLTSAKDRLFVLGNNYNISFPIRSSNVEGSRIYFTLEKDKSLYSYNMEDQSILISLPCPDLSRPYKARPYWIMPDLNLVNKEEPEEPEEKDVDVVLISGSESIKKKTLTEDAKEVEKMNLVDLPWLVLNGIARHLTLVDYMNFRAVSRVCCSVAPPICWKTQLAGPNYSRLLSPWLIFPENNKGVYHLVDPRQNNRYFLKIPNLLLDTSIRCSKEGWLLMSKGLSLTLFNPFTKDIIQLPDVSMDMSSGITSFILASSPSSSSPDSCYYVVVISQLHTSLFISTIRRGENQWQYFQTECEKPLPGAYNTPVLCGGDFYFLNQKGMLEFLNIEDEDKVSWDYLDEPVAPCTSFHQNYLVECDGDLLAIFVGKLGESVKIFKLNFSKLIWEKVTSLRTYTLYISRSSSFSAVVKNSPEMANRIYFPRLHNQAGGSVFYSLDTGKFHALGGEEHSLMNYYNTAGQLDCGWIEPSWC